MTLCQGYLDCVAAGPITCRPCVSAVRGSRVTFCDRSEQTVDAIVCATGYDVHLPYLDDELRRTLGPGPTLYHHTLHPDLAGFGMIGQFVLQGPNFPVL